MRCTGLFVFAAKTNFLSILLFPFVRGLGLGASLIIAIGVQNVFVLRQGLRRERAGQVALICAGCDAFLITLGAAGFGTLIAQVPGLARLDSWGGALFLLFYGLQAFRRALSPHQLETADTCAAPRGVIVGAFSVTLLNPHVYLDTVVLVGGLAGQYAALPRVSFALGAICASLLWFFVLAYGAAYLAPLFHRPKSWQVLDCLVGAVMWVLAFTLVRG